MSKIAISYRRSDSAAMTGRIVDQLAARYGRESIFLDVEDIPLGVDFRVRVQDALRHSQVLLVVIGRGWVGAEGSSSARLREPDDPVRIEVETGLRKRIPLIPVLVDRGTMPKASDLPTSLAELAYRNAAEIDSGIDFHVHMDRLIKSIDRILGENANVVTLTEARPAVRAASATSSNADSASAIAHHPEAARWTTHVVRYLILPIIALVVAHHLIVNTFDLNTIYLRLAGMVIPFLFGLLFFWQARLRSGSAVCFGATIGIVATVLMSVSAGLNANQPIIPTTVPEWRENIEYVVSIVLSFVAGYMLARGLLLLKLQRFGNY
jgi:hypothetical protein